MRLAKLVSSVLLGAVFGSAISAPAQQKGFKVYISADMEGITGLVDNTQVSPTGRDYAYGRKLMTAEVNAAVAAAFEAGASEVLVNDSHWNQTNLQPDQLDRRAVLITGAPKPFGMMQGLDETFAAVIFIGYHAQASTTDGVLDHTFDDRSIRSVRLNGHEVGEYGLNAALAGHFGVPVVFISGDRAVTEQARAFIPGVEALAVKEGIGRTAARTMHPEMAREKIAAGIKAALVRRSQVAPVRPTRPVTIEIELTDSSQADSAMRVPGMKRVSGRVVSYTAPDMAVAYQVSRLVTRLAAQ